MKPLHECLELARGVSPQDFVREHPHPVLIGLGVLPGELQRNPAKASGTLFLNLSPDQPTGGASTNDDALVNQVFEVRKRNASSADPRIEVGGTVESDVDIPDHTVSRNHAHFEVDGAQVTLIDGGSTNGTFVNGARVEANTSLDLSAGDIVTFGRYSFTFYDAMAFAKLLSVQAMMRPRGASRRAPGGRGAAQLGGGGPRRATAPRPGAGRPPVARRPGGAQLAGPPAGPGRGVPGPGRSTAPPRSRSVDPFLGLPREGRFTTPEEARRVAATTDPRRAFPAEVVEQLSQKKAEPPQPAAPPVPPAQPGPLARFWAGFKRVVRWLFGMG